MVLNSKELIGLPVRTRMGEAFGKVASVDVDTDTGRLTTIRVNRGIVKGWTGPDPIVAWNQIVEITAEAVIVQDAAIPAAARTIAMAPDVASAADGGASLSVRTDAESMNA